MVRLRVREGSALHGWDDSGAPFHYSVGEEFVVPYAEAAELLAGKGRRGVEIVEVFDDSGNEPARRALP